jgi:hypothetical protein
MLLRSREYHNYMEDSMNFKHVVQTQFKLQTSEKNMVIDLHNKSKGGELMFQYLQKLEK